MVEQEVSDQLLTTLDPQHDVSRCFDFFCSIPSRPLARPTDRPAARPAARLPGYMHTSIGASCGCIPCLRPAQGGAADLEAVRDGGDAHCVLYCPDSHLSQEGLSADREQDAEGRQV